MPLLAAVAISRAWRLTWSVRAGALVVGFGALAVFAERGAIDIAVPSTSMLSVPIALGLALSGAAVAGGFGADVLRRGFGWRQPIGLIANLGIVVGVDPGDARGRARRVAHTRHPDGAAPGDPVAERPDGR